MSSTNSDQPGKGPKIAVAIGLFTLAIIIGYWRMRSDRPEVLTPAPVLPVANEYVMKCKGCKSSFTMPWEQFETWPRTDAGFKCPKCNSFNTEPDNSKVTPMVEVPNGG